MPFNENVIKLAKNPGTIEKGFIFRTLNIEFKKICAINIGEAGEGGSAEIALR